MNIKRTRVVLGDDHRLVIDGLAALIEREGDLELVGKAHNGIDLLRLIDSTKPDLVVTDLSMPLLNGMEVIHRLHSDYPQLKVICLSMHNEIRIVQSALDAGALAYVLKENSSHELIEAIRRVRIGQMYLSGELIGEVLADYRSRHSGIDDGGKRLLSLRERELIQLMSEGHSTQEIAKLLCISGKTVATHRENIFKKLNVDNIAELTRYAIKEGLSPLGARKGMPVIKI